MPGRGCRYLRGDLAVAHSGDPEQLRLSFARLTTDEAVVYQYAVLPPLWIGRS